HRHGGGSPRGHPLQLPAAAAGPRRARRTRAMKRWFARLPIHRKLVVMALLVTTTALLIAGTGLVLVDLWRFRSAAHEEATATARVLAENAVAAVAFGDREAARSTLDSVRVRPAVRRACLYLPDDT